MEWPCKRHCRGLEYSATVWHPRQKYNSDKLEIVQRRAARFVKGRYGMFESVTQMLEQLTWTQLSKRRENSRLILFYKIINNLAVLPHSCLEKADVRTRKKHSQKFRHIGYNIDPYGQSFFPNCISVWNGLAKDIVEANTLDIISLNYKIRLHQHISKHIRQRILLINEPEPEQKIVQRRAARFVKGRYRMFESVTQLLEQLTWIPLSKRRENSRLFLFYKIINNLAVVPHSCLEKADVRTRKKHSQKFRHIGYNIDPYGQSFFPNCISAWNGLAKDIAEANTLDIFKSKLQN